MFSTDRSSLRRVFLDAWHKYNDRQPLQPLEGLVVEVVRQHPEYHPVLEQDDAALHKDYLPETGETNPFLHLAMHVSLGEQVASDRPPGIRDLYQRLVRETGHPHEAEHRLMECLGLSLWEAQRAGRLPDEAAYLECVRKLVGRPL
jgi:hypothetical protein